jgi:hypothetical protein
MSNRFAVAWQADSGRLLVDCLPMVASTASTSCKPEGPSANENSLFSFRVNGAHSRAVHGRCICRALACQCSARPTSDWELASIARCGRDTHTKTNASAAPTGQSTVIPNETNAPARVLQAPGRYSMRRWAKYILPLYHYVLVSTSKALIKSVGYKAVGRL